MFVFDGDLAIERDVEVGHRSGLRVQILSGLEPGETIVVHPSDRVTDGVRVRPRNRGVDEPGVVHAAVPATADE